MTRDLTSLTPAGQKRYLEYLRDGSPVAILSASMMLRCAEMDASAIRQAKQIIANRPAETKGRKETDLADERIADIRQQIAALQADLDEAIRARKKMKASAGFDVYPLKMLATNPAVRAVLKSELAALGV